MHNLQNSILFTTSTIVDGNMSFRFGKEKDVIDNRNRFLEKNRLDYQDCICMRCDHGSKIFSVNRRDFTANFGAASSETMLESEVLVTNEPGTVLMLLTADCLPTAFYDPIQKVIALAHLNRKTIAHDLGQKTVSFLTEHYNTDPANLLVAIGPHIKKESYRFELPLNTPIPLQLKNHTEESAGFVSLDLAAAEIDQLTKVGVQKKHIAISNIDSATSPDYFSHYQNQRDAQYPAGRMATIFSMHSQYRQNIK